MCSTRKQKCNDQNKYTQDNGTENKGHRLKALSKLNVMECLWEQDD